jgi:hypothetical protein
MSLDLISVTLTQHEVELLLRYGYPFEHEEKQLRHFEGKAGLHVLKVDSFYLSHLIGDLIRSAKTIRSNRLLEELDELCTALENAERGSPQGKLFGGG